MIKNIFLKKIDSLDPNDGIIKINFSNHINVIIGEKGSGKSTLFDLLATIKEGYISSNVEDALKSYGLEFIKVEFYNGEFATANSLIRKKENYKKENFASRTDVIFQDDPIKKNLNNFETIKDEKYHYALECIQKHNDKFNPLLKKIEDFHTQIKTICSIENIILNWTTTFEMNGKNTKLNILSQLNYSNNEINISLQKEIDNLNLIIKNYKEQISFIRSNQSRMNFSSIYNDVEFNEKLNVFYEDLVKKYEEFILFLVKRLDLINKIKIFVTIFNKVYSNKINEIKQSSETEQRIKTFEKQSKDYFKNFAKKLFNAKRGFEELLKKEIYLEINSDPKEINLLTYKLKDKILINDDHIIEMLKIVLYTPKSRNDFSKWIIENQKPNKNFKPYDEKKIINYIAKKFKNDDDVLVYANDKEYSTMSLGQRSIFGIVYKFNHSKEYDLFLDQPEDNLDNNTIATTILDLIESKKENQVMIVTHNANIGILSKPEKIIVAQLNDKDNPYIEGKIVSIEGQDEHTNLAFYLEGGLEYLQKRYRIVKGEQ